MDLINQQIQTLMDNQSQVSISQPPQDQTPQMVLQNSNANNEMTEEQIARVAGRGIDREGGNYQC